MTLQSTFSWVLIGHIHPSNRHGPAKVAWTGATVKRDFGEGLAQEVVHSRPGAILTGARLAQMLHLRATEERQVSCADSLNHPPQAQHAAPHRLSPGSAGGNTGSSVNTDGKANTSGNSSASVCSSTILSPAAGPARRMGFRNGRCTALLTTRSEYSRMYCGIPCRRLRTIGDSVAAASFRAMNTSRSSSPLSTTQSTPAVAASVSTASICTAATLLSTALDGRAETNHERATSHQFDLTWLRNPCGCTHPAAPCMHFSPHAVRAAVRNSEETKWLTRG